MKKKFNLVLIVLILLFGLFFSLYYINSESLENVDVVEINNIKKTFEENWGDVHTIPKTELKFKAIDLNGNTIYSNFNEAFMSYDSEILNSVKNKDIIVDISNDNKIVGKLIIKNDVKQLDLVKKRLNVIVIIIFTLLIFVCILYNIYLNVYLYRPFIKLKNFAARVANGNLDVPIEMDKHNVFGAFTESFDIMRDKLKIAKQNEYLANKSKKELIASLSHDIKTPIASIKAICEIMQLTLSNKDEALSIKTIYEKSDQIDKLVNDMFQSTLHELCELKVEPQIYSSSIIFEIIKNNNFYKKIKFENSCPECLIFVDMLRIEQVIDNIINNSYKYANTDILVSFELNEAYMLIAFEDYGQGVSEDELPLIFNKFYRGSNTLNITGSGLGLFLSEYFIMHMQGDIECYNNSDGFTVKVYLKLA